MSNCKSIIYRKYVDQDCDKIIWLKTYMKPQSTDNLVINKTQDYLLGQSKENRTLVTKRQWNLFYLKVIYRSVYIYPTGRRDDQFQIYRKRQVADGSTATLALLRLIDTDAHEYIFLSLLKIHNSQMERSRLHGGCLSASQPNF